MNKFIRSIITAAAAGAIACTAVLSASAATSQDAINAAKSAGVPGIYVQQLENYLKTASFTSDQYQLMVDTVSNVSDTYISELAQSMYGKTPAELTEEEKTAVGKKLTGDQKQAIINAFVNLGDKVGVKINVDHISKGNYNIEVAAPSDNSSGSGNTTIVVDTDPVANTGENETESSAAAAIAAGSLLLTASGAIVILAKKNKA
ncbi:MAG: hypothetical protein U0M95_05560 [Ruminococcus sp.]